MEKLQIDCEQEASIEEAATNNEAAELVSYLLVLKGGILQAGLDNLLQAAYKILKEAGTLVMFVISQNINRLFIFSFLSATGDTLLQASFGICFTLQSLFFKTLNYSSLDKIGIDLSLALGARDMQRVKKTFLQGLVTMCLLFALVTFPLVFFAGNIMVALGYSAANAAVSQYILRLLAPAMFLEIAANTVRTFCMSQGHEQIFGRAGLLNTLFCTLLSYVTIVHLDCGVYGFVAGVVVMEASNLLLALVVLQRTNPESRGLLPWSQVREGLLDYIFETFKFCLSMIFETLGYELSSYFVALTHDNGQISAVASMFSLTSIIYKIGLSVAAITRTRVNILLGMKQIEAAKNTYIFACLLTFVLGFCASVLLFFSRASVASFYTSRLPEVRMWLVELLFIFCFFLPSEMTLTMSILGIRTINKQGLLSGYTLFFLILLNLPLSLLARSFDSSCTVFFPLMLSLYLLLNLSSFLTTVTHKWNI